MKVLKNIFKLLCNEMLDVSLAPTFVTSLHLGLYMFEGKIVH